MKNNDIIKDVNNDEIKEKIKKYKEYKVLKDQIEGEMKNITNDIKEFLTDIGENNIAVGEYKVKLTTYAKSTFDKNIILQEAPELYEKALGSTPATKLIIN